MTYVSISRPLNGKRRRFGAAASARRSSYPASLGPITATPVRGSASSCAQARMKWSSPYLGCMRRRESTVRVAAVEVIPFGLGRTILLGMNRVLKPETADLLVFPFTCRVRTRLPGARNQPMRSFVRTIKLRSRLKLSSRTRAGGIMRPCRCQSLSATGTGSMFSLRHAASSPERCSSR